MHEKRIQDELRAAGVTRYGMMKFSVRFLPKVIHEDEHIHGVVYGRYRDKTGSLTLNEGLLVATEKRILFLDHKPGYTDLDEITYDIVSGINISEAGFTAVVLHTKLGDYTLRFTNKRCAIGFARYVEKRHLETVESLNGKK